MRPLLKQFLITFAAVALALGGYAVYEQAQMREQAETLRTQTRKDSEILRQQADALSKQAAALKTQVDDEHQQAAADRERLLRATYLSEGLVAAAAGKTAIAEYYLTRGELPTSNRDVGMPEPDQFKGKSLRRLQVSARGVITLSYDGHSGVDGGTIQMIPEVGNAAMGVKWRCVTASYPDIPALVPQCEYQPATSAISAG